MPYQNEQVLKATPNLFGLPYQFPDMVDPRLSDVNVFFGNNFARNIIMEAPICTIVPGLPNYLPRKSKGLKESTAAALLAGESSGDGNIWGKQIKQELSGGKWSGDELRLYDFKNAYVQYINYVNVLCRAGAVYLELQDNMLNNKSFQQYNWLNYRWDKLTTKQTQTINSRLENGGYTALQGFLGLAGGSNKSTAFSNGKVGNADGKSSSGSLSNLFTNHYFVQFYVDADVSSGESLSNAVGSSQFAQLFETGSSAMKEVAFLMNSGGLSNATEWLNSSVSNIQAGLNSLLTSSGHAGGILSRLVNLGGDVLKGYNLVIPDIYQSSQYSKSYSITVHLKSPYGSKLGYYLDIFVPMMHLMALAMPRMASANSYDSPFLVKAHVEGIFSCNLGIVDSISVNRIAESWSVDGLPTEVDVTITITDLYSSLSMAPAGNLHKFMTNSSLLEFLATNCGLSITKPALGKKLKALSNIVINQLLDIPTNVVAKIGQAITTKIMSFMSIYNLS